MIIDAFKNKIFPRSSTNFEGDLDEDEFSKKRDKEGRIPTLQEVAEPEHDETFE